MKIAIDARFINPANRGLSTYTRNLVFGLEKLALGFDRGLAIESDQGIDQKNLYYILLRERDYATLKFRNPRFKKIKAEAQWYGIKEQLLIPKILYRIKPDLTHFPHFNVPIIYNRPYITTIHDLILFAYPTKKATTLGPLAYAIKDRAYRLTINHALKKAKAIIAVSKNTSKDILRFFSNVEKNKIHTIYEGAGGEIFPSPQLSDGRRRDGGRVSSIQKYQADSEKKRRQWLVKKVAAKFPYIFYIGGAYPHKNLERLMFAFNSARKNYQDKTGKKLHIVIAGGEDYFFNRLKELAGQSGLKNIIFPGFIQDRSKTFEFLYQEALFCIFPSLYEGFGLPPLEALKRKKLVLCHNGTCFPEILGDSVIYFDGNSVASISEAILNTLTNLKALEKKYLPRAQKTLAKYSWEKAAKETLELYKKIIKE